jgi:hypothetical protein
MQVPTGMTATISAHYLRLQQELHRNPGYGTASFSYAPLVKEVMGVGHFRSLSDYGAGKKNLWTALNQLGLTDVDYFPYDPVFPEYGRPKSADLVCCIDVLEHIEPELLDNVLNDLESITSNVGLFTIHTGPAVKTLPDGRNAHLIQEPSAWWLPKLSRRFEIRHLQTAEQGFWVIVEPLGGQGSTALSAAQMTRLASMGPESYGHRRTFFPKRLAAKLGMMPVVRRIAKSVLTSAQYELLRGKLK